jgi:hypothetical protein
MGVRGISQAQEGWSRTWLDDGGPETAMVNGIEPQKQFGTIFS